MTSLGINTGDLNSKLAHPRALPALIVRMAAVAAVFFACSLCFAQSDLIRLVPPDAPVLAGMRRMPAGENKDVLWLATKNNTADLKQLVSLTESDPARRFDRVIVADLASNTDSLGSHLLLTYGRFSFDSITLSALAAGAAKTSYHGVPVLVFDPVAMGSPGFRWLAVPEPDIAIVGSPVAVQNALSRYLSHTAADPRVVERLKKIPERDAAWSSVALDSRTVQSHLKLNGNTGSDFSCLRHIRELGLGIQLGPTVKIDLSAEQDSIGLEDAAIGCLRATLFRDGSSTMRVALSGSKRHAMQVGLSREEYDRWLSVFQRSMVGPMLEAMIPARADGDSDRSASLPGAQ